MATLHIPKDTVLNIEKIIMKSKKIILIDLFPVAVRQEVLIFILVTRTTEFLNIIKTFTRRIYL